MSDCLVMCRPVFSVPIAGRSFDMAASAYAHPSMTFVAWINPALLLSLSPRYFNHNNLSTHPYEKGTAPGRPVTMPQAFITGGQVSYPVIGVKTPGLLQFLAESGMTHVPLAITAENHEFIAPFVHQTLEAQEPVTRLEDLCMYSQPYGQVPPGFTDYVTAADLSMYVEGALKLSRAAKGADCAETQKVADLVHELEQAGLHGARVQNPYSMESIARGVEQEIGAALRTERNCIFNTAARDEEPHRADAPSLSGVTAPAFILQ